MFRQANREDVAQIFPLLDIIWQDMDFPLRRLLDKQTFQQIMLELMQQPLSKYSYQNCIVHIKHNEIIGILVHYAGALENELDEQFYTFIDQKLPSLNIRHYRFERESHDNEWYLDSLVVQEQYRQQGIGKHFFSVLPQFIPYSTQIGLNCDINNTKAKHLYEKLGFQTQYTTNFLNHNYYHMEKWLDKL